MKKIQLLLFLGFLLFSMSVAVQAAPVSFMNSTFSSRASHGWTLNTRVANDYADTGAWSGFNPVAMTATGGTDVVTINDSRCILPPCVMSFGNTNDALVNAGAASVLNNSQPAKLSFSGWITYNDSRGGVDPYFMGMNDKYKFDFFRDTSGGTGHLFFSLRGVPQACAYEVNGSISDTRHQFAWTYDNSTKNVTVYIDGSVNGSQLCSGGAFTPEVSASTQFTFMNHFSGSGDAMSGVIDDMALYYNYILTPAQVLELYNGTPPAITILDTRPPNGTQFHASVITYNVTVNSTSNWSVSLFLNGVLNTSVENIPQQNTTFSVPVVYPTFIETTVLYNFTVQNRENVTASAQKTIFLDTVNPVITWHVPANDNSSIFNTTFSANISVTNTNLANVSETVFYPNGSTLLSLFVVTNTSSYQFSNSIPVNASVKGVYPVTVIGCDLSGNCVTQTRSFLNPFPPIIPPPTLATAIQTCDSSHIGPFMLVMALAIGMCSLGFAVLGARTWARYTLIIGMILVLGSYLLQFSIGCGTFG